MSEEEEFVGVDIWEQKYRAIGIDRNFLTGVTERQSVYHSSNITSTECKQFYFKLMEFIMQRMAKKISTRQSAMLQYFIIAKQEYKTASITTDKTIQNTHKMFNKDVIGKMKREIFRDKAVKDYIFENAPSGMKSRLLEWFDIETQEHYYKKCCACGFKMTSEHAFVQHLIKYEQMPPNTNTRKLKSYKNHQEIIQAQKKIVLKYFRKNDYTVSNLNEFLLHSEQYGFICNRDWIIHYWKDPIQLIDFPKCE